METRTQYLRSRRGLPEVLEIQKANGMISEATYRRLAPLVGIPVL